jgi:hypothetical protein
VAFLLSMTLAAAADHYASFYVIPVASHTPGAFDSLWMSDVALHNFQGMPITVEMTFVRSGHTADNTTALGPAVTIPAGGSVLLRDVVSAGAPAAGAILIGADAPFAITSRSYSELPGGGTVGQTVLAARDFVESAADDVDNAAAVAYLPGLAANASFRTNVGFVAATANDTSGLTISVRLRNESGAAVGQRTFFVPGGALMHVQFPASSLGTAAFEAGAAEVRITSGDGAVVPYASVIDNTSSDAVFVLGQFPEASGTAAAAVRGHAFRRFLRPQPVMQ